MENVKVSVIVPVYNVETYLEEALMSLKNQTLKEIEFLIINDGSTDNSQKIIEEIAQDGSTFSRFQC
ncbi:glycosyltransferase family 2 protein [Enterococcus faecalis]|uniref:glycosyltransferase family 2 protein n=1 Tax=Enterococcus faecalis TaxID=1351 RepID=UPI00215D3377|nr:glycosyltransferase family 2 protein [Enterococcus faecalis]